MELPRNDTQWVSAERAKLLGQIDLKTLVQDFSRAGMCIQVVYNCVTAVGPKFTELQIEVQDLGFDVRKLCDKLAITVTKFKERAKLYCTTCKPHTTTYSISSKI